MLIVVYCYVGVRVYVSTVSFQLLSKFIASPSFVNVLVSWSANALNFCAIVVFRYIVAFVCGW